LTKGHKINGRIGLTGIKKPNYSTFKIALLANTKHIQPHKTVISFQFHMLRKVIDILPCSENMGRNLNIKHKATEDHPERQFF